MLITDKLHKLKYAGLLLRHVSAIECSHPQGVDHTKEVCVKTGHRRHVYMANGTYKAT
jgi:hypothetical protein